MMISKVSDGEIVHVKALAFKIIKYLLDGMIDKEISDDDFAAFKTNQIIQIWKVHQKSKWKNFWKDS